MKTFSNFTRTKKGELVVFQNTTVVKETNPEKSGQFEKCVVMNNSYDDTIANGRDIFEVLRGDKLKTKIFEAKFWDGYNLKKGMQFNKYENHTENQAWSVYYHDLGDGRLVAFLKYTWSSDTFSKHFVKVEDEVSSAYDLKYVDITCHSGVKVFQPHWEIKSKNKAMWTCRVTSNEMNKDTVQKYLKSFSKNIIVDSIDYTVNNSGMHSYACRDFNLYDLTINVSVDKVKTETISISEVMAKTYSNKYFADDNKIYLISENSLNPSVIIFYLKDGLADKINSKYNSDGNDILGKKIIFKEKKETSKK